MNYRLAKLLASESINTAGTKTIEITLKDLISRFNIQIKATNNGATPTAHPAKIIKKIEVVDGSDVLFGLSGQEALAMSFYDSDRTPFVTNNYLNDTMNIVNYEVNFGRYLYDQMLALDPKQFTNPQLKITHDLALGGCAPDAATLRVTAHVFDEKQATLQGFLMSKENVSYSLVASGNEYIDLPVDHTIRKLIVMSLFAGKQPYQQFNEIKLSEDNDKRIPVDDFTSDLIKYFAQNWRQVIEYIDGAALTTTRTFYMMSTYEVVVTAIAMGFTAAYMKSDYMYGGTVDIRGSAAANFKALVRGMCPFGSVAIPFGDQNMIDDWYKLTDVGNLRLTLKAGSSIGASSTCEVLTQQLRTY